MTLTKADLVQQVYKNHEELTKAQATESVEAFLKISKESLINGSDLLLSDELTLDARRVVTFKPSGILRDKINS